MLTINQIWAKLETQLNLLAPEIVKDLNEKADDFLFSALQSKIGAVLPTDFVELYKIHNGQNFEIGGGFIGCEQWLPINAIIDEWNIWKKLYDQKTFDEAIASPDSGIQNIWWSPLWIPLTGDGAGNNFCMDLAPANGGKYGQIIRMWHDHEHRELIAGSISEWFEKIASDLENGFFQYSDDAFGMIRSK